LISSTIKKLGITDEKIIGQSLALAFIRVLKMSGTEVQHQENIFSLLKISRPFAY
jgi:hypothetical protein